ncbi:MAG: hypothetical protein H6978_10135 [Gammaproteobacteria bacterium]|nr:hypothetical protein [Gammaproteobacteria bacterium]
MAVTNVQAASLTAGIEDNFALPSEPATPSAAMLTALQGFAEFAGVSDFDLNGGINNGQSNVQVAHTFTGLPGGIISATLTLSLRAGTDTFAISDGIALSFIQPGQTDYLANIAYSRLFGADGAGSILFDANDPGLLTSGQWVPGSQAMFTLNLAALPLAGGGTLNLLPMLNSFGFLDVNISDDTAVDFMRLEVTPVPLPAAILPMVSGVLLLGFKRRRSAC